MSVIAAIFLVVSMWLAVLLGPKLDCWMWGPALLALGLAVLAAVPGCWRRRAGAANVWVIALGTLVTGWFAWRAWVSPVADDGMADLLLLAAAVGGFVVMRAIQGQVLAERVFLWGLACLVLASGVMVAWQVVDPDLAPLLVARISKLPAGFFGHYNYGANFLIGSSCLLGGAALVGRYGKVERLLWGVIAVAGLLAVYFTRSRGGICGAATALGFFTVMALIIGKRQGARWFAPGILALPLLGIVVAGFLFKGWSDAQQVRNQEAGIDAMMDNSIRLYLIGIATSCISLHPWDGGGSRSFSWECYRFWEMEVQGPASSRPEQVHNEFIQAATDYGVSGAGLLGLFVGTLVVLAVLRILFADSTSESANDVSWHLGGLAGLAGILIQSNFSFVFHMVPGALLLGICLGRTAHHGMSGQATARFFPVPGLVVSAIALACAALLLPMGWLGTQVTAVRWAETYGKPLEIAPDARIAALTEAIRLWPLGAFFQQRAEIFQSRIVPRADGTVDEALLERAMRDYREASARHPFAPGLAVNLANLLSSVGRNHEAEAEFGRALCLQGGMEAAFRGNFFLARHYQQKAIRQLAANEVEPALKTLHLAAAHIEKAAQETPPWVIGGAGRNLRIWIHENLGMACEMAGDPVGALAAYDFASSIPAGSRAHFRAASLLGRRAAQTWYERKPAEALAGFLAAKQRVSLANDLPAGVTQAQKTELWEYLNRSILFLKGAKIEPAASPDN
jgi:tetratricopeptide (TPR) repeat protein